MDIKNKIQSEVNDYQIKTTSQDILSRFELEKVQKKKKVPLWIPFTSSLSLVAVSSLIAVLCVNFLPKQDDNPNTSDQIENAIQEVVPLDDNSILSQAGLQLFYSSQFQQKTENNQKKNALRWKIEEDITINVTDKEKRIQDTYTPLFSFVNDFFTTDNQLSITYGKTSFQYGGIKYSYVLQEGENKLYTKKDLNSSIAMTDALFFFGKETYHGFIYIENDKDDEEQTIRSTFINQDKRITIHKDTEEGETGLLYQISDLSEDSKNILETYKISTEFSKNSSQLDECEILHTTTNSFVKAKTEYDKEAKKYEVEYTDITYVPYSLIKTDFSFTIDETGNLKYFF